MPKCHYCPEEATTRDHIVPRALLKQLRLPDNHIFPMKNIVPACAPCNNEKADLDSGCECDRCVEAWYLYDQLCDERESWEGVRIVYTSETQNNPSPLSEGLVYVPGHRYRTTPESGCARRTSGKSP